MQGKVRKSQNQKLVAQRVKRVVAFQGGHRQLQSPGFRPLLGLHELSHQNNISKVTDRWFDRKPVRPFHHRRAENQLLQAIVQKRKGQPAVTNQTQGQEREAAKTINTIGDARELIED